MAENQYNPWAIRDFTEGQIDRVDDNLLPENAARKCRNWISRIIGRMGKRRGQERLNSAYPLPGSILGIHAYYQGLSRKLVIASKGGLYEWNGVNAFNSIHSGWDDDAQVLFETCANYMVAFNGIDQPIKWDGTDATELSNAPIDGQYPTLHKDKLFVVPKSSPSDIWWANSFQPEQWPASNWWQVKPGDGDVITCLRRLFDEMIIFKSRSIHSFRGTSLDDFSLYELESDIGCAGPRAAATHLNKMYFVSEKGLFEFNGMKVTNISDERIPRLWTRVNTQAVYNAAVVSWDGWIWFALPIDESPVNNLVVVYNPVSKAFWPMEGIEASCFQIFSSETGLKLYSGDTSQGHVIQQDTGTEDFPGDEDEAPVAAYWEGKGYDQGYPEHEKSAKRAYVEDVPGTVNPANIDISVNYGEYAPLIYKRTNKLIRMYQFPKELRKWNYLSPRISHDQPGSCEVRGLMVRYKIKLKPKIREVKSS